MDQTSLNSYLSTPIATEFSNANITLPLPPEPFAETWQRYQLEAHQITVWQVLQKRLPQLHFPIQSNISQTEAYKVATRRGNFAHANGHGLVLDHAETISLEIHQSIAGLIPVLIAPHRPDFEVIVQAFIHKNEPVPIPDSMGACMVAGYNNWDRIWTHRKAWQKENKDNQTEGAWQAEFKRLIPQKHLYQDRFIILHNGPYSGVPSQAFNLREGEWQDLSLQIRLEHECTHYFTKRVFGVMRQHVYDELLADYAGIKKAIGYFRADWLLHFMGLENFPQYRQGGRLQNYLHVPATSETFTAVQTHLKKAAENLEIFDAQRGQSQQSLKKHAMMLLAITQFTLAQLAQPEAPQQLSDALYKIEQKQGGN